MHGELHRKIGFLSRQQCRRTDDNPGRSAALDDFRDWWNDQVERAVARVAELETGFDHLANGNVAEVDTGLIDLEVWGATGAGCVWRRASSSLPGQHGEEGQDAKTARPAQFTHERLPAGEGAGGCGSALAEFELRFFDVLTTDLLY